MSKHSFNKRLKANQKNNSHYLDHVRQQLKVRQWEIMQEKALKHA